MSATAERVERPRTAYTADGHVLSVSIADGYLTSHISCPGAPTCKAQARDGTCVVKWTHDDVGLEFIEWQDQPHRAASLPCVIEWREEGGEDDYEIWWRPVVFE